MPLDNLLQFSAAMSSGEISDASEREQALDVRRSWIVEAPAGSGKTGLLIQRYLKLLGDDSVSEPGQVLAITFTVKATAEMRSRVVKYLEAAHLPLPAHAKEFDRVTNELAVAVMQRSKALGWDLLAQPQRMNIRTIDSITSEIVSALPLLSGSGGPRGRATHPETLHREAARRTLMQLGGRDSQLDEALHVLLRHRDGNLIGCERLIAAMLSSREQWGRLVPLGDEELKDSFLDQVVRPKLEHALEQIVCAGLTRLTNVMPRPFLQELNTLASEMGHLEGYNGAESPIAFCAGLHTAPAEKAEDLSHWRALIHLMVTASSPRKWRAVKGINKKNIGFEISPIGKAALGSLIDDVREDDHLLQALLEADTLPPAQYPEEQWLIAKALFRILRRAMIELKLLFAEREECDYTEITLGAKAALSHESGVNDYAGAVGMKLQHLLVDEVQDTSLSQYDLIEMLTRGWDGQSQTVFLVGDPKQSIYLFRQARVERFLRMMHDGHLGELTLDTLRLTANFRSQQGLVRQFNDDFAQIFPQQAVAAAYGDVPFVQASAVRPVSTFEGVVWHAKAIDARSDDRAQAKQETRDADEICRLLQQWRSHPLPEGRTAPWKIAVLVRARMHLGKMVHALKEAALPFRAVKVEPLDERQEVLDVFALTRALLHPADRTAWFAILRAPWCGLSLVDLHRLAGADDAEWSKKTIEQAILERGELLSPDGCDRLSRTWDVLDAALAERGRLTTAQWVERTWRSLGGDAYATAEELTNVEYYLRLLDELEKEGSFIDLAQLSETMHSLYAQPVATPGAIDLMTIHEAKGLEWDFVVIPSLERRTRSGNAPLLNWLELDLPGEDAAHVLLAPIHGTGQDAAALYRWIQGAHKRRDDAELKRLFYVACTRAREELHLFATPQKKQSGEPSVPSGSLLNAAWPAARQLFEAPQQPSVETESAETLEAGTEALKPATIRRTSLDFDPRERFRQQRQHRLMPASHAGARVQQSFDRPEGSFAARAFGNTVHACMEELAARIAQGATPEMLLLELATWEKRTAALLRNAGLSPQAVGPWAIQTIKALENTLRDETGRWLLAPHSRASSETALDLLDESGSSIRLDRMFMAGTEPMSSGEDVLWIVDFKTADPGSRDPENFFAEQKDAYRPQMETYARALQTDGTPIRLALYYPLATKLVWWSYEVGR